MLPSIPLNKPTTKITAPKSIRQNGIHLETISQELQQENRYHQNIQFRDQIALVESLLVHIDKDVDLPKEAASGLADLMVKMHLVCERVFK